MAQQAKGQAPLELEMWTFRDQATRQVPRDIAEVDADAMQFCMTLRTASNVVLFDLTKHLAGHAELNAAMLNVLLIANLNDEIEFRRLIKFANMKKATASALVDTMVKQGLLSRRTSPEDRRVLLLSLTDEGRALFEEAFKQYNERERYWASLLEPEERELLVKLLTNMVNRGLEELALGEEPTFEERV